jgi:hypothetical protein
MKDKCDQAGVWKRPDLELASDRIGEPITQEEFKRDFLDTGKVIILDKGYYFLVGFIEEQCLSEKTPELRETCAPHKKVLLLLDAYGIDRKTLKPTLKGISTLAVPYQYPSARDKEEEEEKEEDKEKEDLNSSVNLLREAVYEASSTSRVAVDYGKATDRVPLDYGKTTGRVAVDYGKTTDRVAVDYDANQDAKGEDFGACETAWLETLKVLGVERLFLRPHEQTTISQLVDKFGAKTAAKALEGARYETKNKGFDPRAHVDISRMWKNFSRFADMADNPALREPPPTAAAVIPIDQTPCTLCQGGLIKVRKISNDQPDWAACGCAKGRRRESYPRFDPGAFVAVAQ